MTEAPERIWADPDGKFCAWTTAERCEGDIEYLRADLMPSSRPIEGEMLDLLRVVRDGKGYSHAKLVALVKKAEEC